MSLTNTTVKQIYSGNGVLTTFAIPFAIVKDASDEVTVYIRDESDPLDITETLQVNGVDYTLAGGNDNFAPFHDEVVFSTAPASTDKVLVVRKTTLTQPNVYSLNGPNPAKTQETAMDRLTAISQEQAEQLSRTLQLKKSSPTTGPIDFPEPEATYAIRWNAAGDALENFEPVEAGAAVTSVNGEVGDVDLELADLSDVDATGPTNGHVLTYNSGTGNWEAAAPVGAVNSVNSQTGTVVLDTDDISEGATNLYYTNARADARIAAASIDDLSDVDAAAPTNGQLLAFNSGTGNWEPTNAGSGAVDSVNGNTGVVVLDTDDIAEGSTNLYYTNARADARIAAANLNDLADVNTGGASVGEVLSFDGTNWIPATGSGAVSSVNGQTGVVVLDTDDIGEGSTNLYFTNARADARITNAVNNFTKPSVQRFTSGSGTYTLPAGVKYIRVVAVGGGGGGGGSGTAASGGTGTDGGTTTFGSSLITANGGAKGFCNGLTTVGGTASVTTSSSVLLVVAVQGETGGSAIAGGTNTKGGDGGSSYLGGKGSGGFTTELGRPATTNSGSGGGGAGTFTTSANSGAGGGAGGYAEAIITSPSSTYSYAVGAGGSGGAAGTSGYAGGAGAAGIIIVEEYYQ